MSDQHHGGDAGGAFAPVQTRDERPWSFDPADFAAPDRNDPVWKFADLAKLAPLFDASGLSGPAVASGAFRPEDLASAIALQRATPRHIVAEGRIDLVIGADDDRVAAEHLIIEAPAHAVSTVIIQHGGSGTLVENVEILVGEGADLTVISIQQWDDDAIHASTHQAVVGRDARLKHVVVTLSGGVVRVNPSVRLEGDGSQAQLLGLAFADAGQHFESQVFLHHAGRHTKGNVTYKGALQGEAARTVWVGDVLIGPNATGTDSYEQNRNLVLSEGARADSIPNLEIETGDIVGAGHASATGRFDDEQLFYLRSRGIEEAEARRLVVLGFLSEIIQQIPDPDLQERLTAAVETELGR
jgi:Fe-S cluster assembly protein SufD